MQVGSKFILLNMNNRLSTSQIYIFLYIWKAYGHYIFYFGGPFPSFISLCCTYVLCFCEPNSVSHFPEVLFFFHLFFFLFSIDCPVSTDLSSVCRFFLPTSNLLLSPPYSIFHLHNLHFILLNIFSSLDLCYLPDKALSS